MEYVVRDVTEWTNNAVTERARIAKEEILTLLMTHCNANSIALAVGEDAQIEQAFSLGVVQALRENED